MELQLTLAGELTEDPVAGGEIERARAGITETAHLLAGLRRHLLPPEICLVELSAKDLAEILIADLIIAAQSQHATSIPVAAMVRVDLNGLLEGFHALLAEMPVPSKCTITLQQEALCLIGGEWCRNKSAIHRPAFLSGTKDYGLRLEAALRFLPAAGAQVRWQESFAFELTIPFLTS